MEDNPLHFKDLKHLLHVSLVLFQRNAQAFVSLHLLPSSQSLLPKNLRETITDPPPPFGTHGGFWQMFESHILFIFLLLLLIFCFYTLCPFLCVTLAVLSICFACSSISHQEFVSPSKWLNDTSLLHLISHISSRDFALFCVTDLVPEQPSPPFSPPVGMRLEIKAHRLLSFYCHMTEIT